MRMKSLRLTNDLKEKIWIQIYRDQFEAKEKQTKIDKKEFADTCYQTIFDFNEQEMMATSPSGAFVFTNDLYMYFGGQQVYLTLSTNKPFFSDYSKKNKLNHEHPLTIRFEELVDQETKIKEDKKIAKSRVYSILNSCTTTNKLLEIWPECKKYLEVAIGEPIVNNLPALNIIELNKMFNLQ